MSVCACKEVVSFRTVSIAHVPRLQSLYDLPTLLLLQRIFHSGRACKLEQALLRQEVSSLLPHCLHGHSLRLLRQEQKNSAGGRKPEPQDFLHDVLDERFQ